MSHQSPTLVLGATGSIGAAVTLELLRRGIPTRAFVRDSGRARQLLGYSPDLQVIEGDVQDAACVDAAVRSCGAVFHAVNYPYHQWAPKMETATRNVLQAVARINREAGAAVGGGYGRAERPVRVFLPGNVYGLGAQTDEPLDESTANRPNSRKGTLRVSLEEMLLNSAERGEIRTLILRAGDYYGPTVRNQGVDVLFGRAIQGRPIRVLGDLDIPHQWAYVPDLARAAADLLELDQRDGSRLSAFEVVHFPGHVARPQRAFLRTVAELAGHANLPIRTWPWWLLRMAGAFHPQVRGLVELRYLWDQSVLITSTRLPKLLPTFRVTLVEEAIRTTIDSYRRQLRA